MPTNSTGGYNLAMGVNTMFNNTTGSQNVALGSSALYSSTTSEGNVSVGNSSLYSNSTGNSNTALGSNALTSTTQGGNNVAIGNSAGRQNTTGSGNVFIGNEAGNTSSYQTASNKLVVANSDTETPLIEGDFNAKTLKVNGNIEVNSLIVNGNSINGTTRHIASFSAQNQSSSVTVIDTIFAHEQLTDFIQGLINYDTGSSVNVYATTNVMFGVAGNQDENVYTHGSSVRSSVTYTNYNPQSQFFFPIKSDYGNNDLQLTITLTGNYANTAVIKGNVWGK